MTQCSHCKQDWLMYHITLRQPHEWIGQLRDGRVLGCGADPSHDIDLLIYDVELA